MESNSVCSHTSDNKIGRPSITKSYCQLIIKITISEKIAKLCDKKKFYIKKTDKGCINLGVCTLFLETKVVIG